MNKKMKTDIILSGVGGQGILTIAAIISWAAVKNKMHIKQAEVHGMAQRGGSVYSHLRLSTEPIYSDLISKGQADLILSVEPMEGLRYLPYLSFSGWLVTNLKPVKNIPDYPKEEELLQAIESVPNHVYLDAEGLARQIKAPKSANIIMLGAASPFLGFKYQDLEWAIEKQFLRKGQEVVDINKKALKLGFDEAHRLFPDKFA